MEKSRKGDLLTVRLRDGEDLLEGLGEALRQEGIDSGVIIGGVGMVRGAAISFYAGKGEYETRPVVDAVELCSMNGNVSISDGELMLHIHVTLGQKGGAGGMGEVYLVQRSRLPRLDALKVLPPALTANAEYRYRFNREAELASTLWHMNIVGIHDRGELNGQLWISMDYVDGTEAGRWSRPTTTQNRAVRRG